MEVHERCGVYLSRSVLGCVAVSVHYVQKHISVYELCRSMLQDCRYAGMWGPSSRHVDCSAVCSDLMQVCGEPLYPACSCSVPHLL